MSFFQGAPVRYSRSDPGFSPFGSGKSNPLRGMLVLVQSPFSQRRNPVWISSSRIVYAALETGQPHNAFFDTDISW